jgi:hypothetical protein
MNDSGVEFFQKGRRFLEQLFAPGRIEPDLEITLAIESQDR